MKNLTKTAYNKIVKAKILQTGEYNGVNVDAAEVDDLLYSHLQDIKQDFKKGVLTLFNADAEIAFNYLKYEEVSDDYELDLDQDDLYGSYNDNMQDIKTHFEAY